MKIAVFGATGPTGQEAVKASLDLGHEVCALVRNPDALTQVNERLKVVKVDIFNVEQLVPELEGCDAVVSCLGAKGGFFSYFSTQSFYSESIKAITSAMVKASVSRLVCITSWCTVYDSSHPKMIEWVLKPLFLGRYLADMARMEDYLRHHCPQLIYTVVRPPGLDNNQFDAHQVLCVEGQFVTDAAFVMPRANVAKFMVDALITSQWDRQMVAIGLPK